MAVLEKIYGMIRDLFRDSGPHYIDEYLEQHGDSSEGLGPVFWASGAIAVVAFGLLILSVVSHGISASNAPDDITAPVRDEFDRHYSSFNDYSNLASVMHNQFASALNNALMTDDPVVFSHYALQAMEQAQRNAVQLRYYKEYMLKLEVFVSNNPYLLDSRDMNKRGVVEIIRGEGARMLGIMDNMRDGVYELERRADELDVELDSATLEKTNEMLEDRAWLFIDNSVVAQTGFCKNTRDYNKCLSEFFSMYLIEHAESI